MKRPSEGPKLKRRSTRHVSEVTAIASELAKIIVPRSWLGRRVIAFLHSEYISKHLTESNRELLVVYTF